MNMFNDQRIMVSDCRYFKLSRELAKEYNISATYINSQKFLDNLLSQMKIIANESSARDVRKVLKVPRNILTMMTTYCNRYSLSTTDLINLSFSLLLNSTEEIAMLVYSRVVTDDIRLTRDNNAQICFKISEKDYEKLRSLSQEKDISIRTFFLFALLKTIGAVDHVFTPNANEDEEII